MKVNINDIVLVQYEFVTSVSHFIAKVTDEVKKSYYDYNTNEYEFNVLTYSKAIPVLNKEIVKKL